MLTDAYGRMLRRLNLVDRNDPITEIIAKKVGQRGVKEAAKMTPVERTRLRRKSNDCLYWARMRSANRPALPRVNIDLPYLEGLWRRQKGCCALTGAPLEFNGPFGITIDRTKPARGYTKRNVRLVGRSANAAKHGMTTAEFHSFMIESYRWLRRKKLAR